MCKTCDFIENVLVSARQDPHYNYVPVLKLMFEIERQKRVDLFAGDCLPDQLNNFLGDETHLTLCHYFKCSTCKRYFFVGFYIRGTPIFESSSNLKNVNLDKRIWGKHGKYFADKI